MADGKTGVHVRARSLPASHVSLSRRTSSASIAPCARTGAPRFKRVGLVRYKCAHFAASTGSRSGPRLAAYSATRMPCALKPPLCAAVKIHVNPLWKLSLQKSCRARAARAIFRHACQRQQAFSKRRLRFLIAKPQRGNRMKFGCRRFTISFIFQNEAVPIGSRRAARSARRWRNSSLICRSLTGPARPPALPAADK